jgi:hypothetical protein
MSAVAASTTERDPTYYGIIVNSATTLNFCPDRSKFTNFKEVDSGKDLSSSGHSPKTTGQGNIIVEFPMRKTNNQPVSRSKTRYTPLACH